MNSAPWDPASKRALGAFVYDDAVSRHVLRHDHPMRPVRLRYVYELLRAYGAFDGRDSLLVQPRPATEEELQSFHTPEYIEAVRRYSGGGSREDAHRYGFAEEGDNPIYEGMYEAPKFRYLRFVVVDREMKQRRLWLSGSRRTARLEKWSQEQ